MFKIGDSVYFCLGGVSMNITHGIITKVYREETDGYSYEECVLVLDNGQYTSELDAKRLYWSKAEAIMDLISVHDATIALVQEKLGVEQAERDRLIREYIACTENREVPENV